jgi:hypothetical protein
MRTRFEFLRAVRSQRQIRLITYKRKTSKVGLPTGLPLDQPLTSPPLEHPAGIFLSSLPELLKACKIFVPAFL